MATTPLKKFITPGADFGVEIPVTWKYSVVDGHVHTFSGFQLNHFDCVQFQIKKNLQAAEKKEWVHLFEFMDSKLLNGVDWRIYPDQEHENGQVITKAWATLWGNDLVMCNLSYLVHPENKQDLSEEETGWVHHALSTFYLIPEEEKEHQLNSYHFRIFLQGIAATQEMLNRSIENKGFIEATCLLASQIDSMLRIAIILKKQIDQNNDLIGKEFIYQGAIDKKISEKDIYKTAKSMGILVQALFDELYERYEDRNRVIHRFIISEITLAEIETIAYQYYLVREKIKQILNDLEEQQLQLKVGMTTTDTDDPGDVTKFMNDILGKIGKVDYFDTERKQVLEPEE